MEEADIPWTGRGGTLWFRDLGEEGRSHPTDHAWLGNGVLACRWPHGYGFYAPGGWTRFEPDTDATVEEKAAQTDEILRELDALDTLPSLSAPDVPV